MIFELFQGTKQTQKHTQESRKNKVHQLRLEISDILFERSPTTCVPDVCIKRCEP